MRLGMVSGSSSCVSVEGTELGMASSGFGNLAAGHPRRLYLAVIEIARSSIPRQAAPITIERIAMQHHPLLRRWRIALGIAGLTLTALGVSTARQERSATRILVLYDMEGASGVLSGALFDPARPDSFAIGRASLIDDVNAVIAGLYDGGATDVVVENGHGYGGDSLVPRDRLDRRASIIRSHLHPYVSSPPRGAPGYIADPPRPPYDAVVTVAMHDKPMSGGFSPHTLGLGISPIVDGKAVTETELVGYNFGTWGIPVIFSSGDDRLRATLAAAMPWVEYVVVKRITTPTVAEALPATDVRRQLHDGALRAARAVQRSGRMKVMRLEPGSRAGLLPSYPLMLPPGMGSLPGIEKHGDTVTFAASDYRAAFWGMFVLQRIARALSIERGFEELGRDSVGRALQRRIIDSAFARGAAFEAGKWKP
jgi:D-amino peptidase